MRDFRDAKAMAQTLRAALDAKGFKITVSQSLELISQSFGVPDWNTLSAAIKGQAAPAPENSPAPAQSASNPGNPPASSTPKPDLSRRLESALQQIFAYARERKHEAVTVEHLLLFLLDDVDVSHVMKACAVNLDDLRKKLTEYIDSHVKSQATGGGGNSQPTLGFQRSLQRAVLLSRKYNTHIVGSERRIPTTCVAVLVGGIFAEEESHAVKLLNEQGVTLTKVVEYIKHGRPDDPPFSNPFE